MRVRPPLQHELADPQYTECVAADPENMTVTVAENLVEAAQSNSPLFGAYSFQFDHVFSPSSNQGEVYDLTGKAAVNAVLSGYNATVIAYGQTGTGKYIIFALHHIAFRLFCAYFCIFVRIQIIVNP